MFCRSVALLSSLVTFVLGHPVADAQSYPDKPIRIVTAGVGGGNDFYSRLIAQGISGPLGQQVIVDNRGGDVIQAEIVAQSQPDGYTILVYGNPLWLGPLLRKTSYDPLKSFSPITWLVKLPNLLVVHPSVASSVKELIALAKAKPGTLNYASGATGGSSHLFPELFKAMAGVNIVRIPYKSGSASITDLIGGQVQLMFEGSSITPHIRSGKLRALAVTSLQASALYPGIPPIAAFVPGYEAHAMFGAWAPAGTPGAIVNRLNQEIVRFIQYPSTKEKLFTAGAEVVGSSPQEFTAVIRADMDKWAKLIREADIRAD